MPIPEKKTFETRLKFFKNDLGDDNLLSKKLTSIYAENNGDWQAIEKALTLENGFKPEVVMKLEFTHNLSLWTNENASLIKMFQKDEKINSMRDLALNFDKAALTQKIKTENALPADTDPETYAAILHRNLFQVEPTAVIQRMTGSQAETPIADKMLSGSVATFLNNQPATFNIRTTSIYQAFKNENAFEGIASDLQDKLKTELKAIQRVVAISPVPEVLPVLMKRNLTSALQVSDMPEENFIKAFTTELGEQGEAIAKEVHTLAVNARIRNEQTLMSIKEVARGTGVAFIDKTLYAKKSLERSALGGDTQRMMYISPEEQVKEELTKNNLSWDLLFNDADFCECGECTSVYSAAAYFVDLLQYLRNNNIDKTKVKADEKDISNTPLEKLFKRRPDLGCLQLTCKNTNTILPYIDLVNEVMENYVVFHYPKPFNVEEDETSGELLAQPQHTEYEAYCILHKTVYPFTLPYHQLIDAARIFLDYLGTSRHELIDTFRPQRKDKSELEAENDSALEGSTPGVTDAEKRELDQLHIAFINRAVDAEYLGLTQEEYVILTKEAFVSKEYWDKQCKKDHSTEEYRTKIGLKPVHEYYGYNSEGQLLSKDESKKEGLTFVKDQFLRRTGILYLDLVELLKTRCINPNMPQGKAESIMESIRFSYRYMQTLVDNGAGNAKAKYEKLVEILTKAQPIMPLVEALLHPDPCSPKKIDTCADTKDLENWVYCYFEKVGKMIVLESGKTECRCPEGQLFWMRDGHKSEVRHFHFIEEGLMMDDGKYFLDADCNIWAEGRVPALNRDIREIIGNVDKGSGKLILAKGKFSDLQDGESIKVKIKNGEEFSLQNDRFISSQTKKPLGCSAPLQLDTCDLNKVRLVHLDGTSVTIEEYDRIQRFIRLWRKLGWSIDETDKALVGLGKVHSHSMDDILPHAHDCDNGCHDLFEESCDCETTRDDQDDCFDCNDDKPVSCEITPAFLHQLVAVKKLEDKTSLELIKLLTFWTGISTAGEKSLYKRLFLTHNLRGIDRVFQADKNGNYLTKKPKIAAHIPVIMAALNLSADDIAVMIEALNLEDTLTLANLSSIYRFRLLSKVLGLKIGDFISVLPLFGDPFKSADATLEFIEQWGKMEDAGFNYHQLNYIISNYDNPKKPLAPEQRTVLQLAKTLYDGLNTIDREHKDVKTEDEVTQDTVKAKAILLFGQSLVEKISGMIEGTNVFTTNAPKNLEIKIDDEKTLAKKLKYDKKGSIQITSTLTAAEAVDFKSLSNDVKWAEALTRIEKQQNKLFKQLLFDVVETEKNKSPERKRQVEQAEKVLKEGDITISVDQIPEGQEDTNTAPKKRIAFLVIFIPYLRQQLIHRFIVDTLSGLVGLDRDTTDVLVSEVLWTGTPPVNVYSQFESIKETSKPPDSNWNGYLIPPADGHYTFVVKDSDSKPSISLNGLTLEFSVQEDPTNEWWGAAQKLQAGKLYVFALNGVDIKNVQWKSTTSSLSSIPSAALLPGFASETTVLAFTQLKKAALLVTGFNLGADEVRYFNLSKSAFDDLDFNAITLKHWLRLEAYVRLRDSLPQTKISILEFFKWTAQAADAKKLTEMISELTLWKKANIDKLVAENHFNILRPDAFLNEINLLKLQQALRVADKIEMDIDLLFEWAKPTSNFKKCREVADSIQKAIRAKYKQEDWEQVVKPLNDKLRENQKNALTAYLLQQPDLIKWGVNDADGLFEYFLIDVQMDACMETSRIKQALCSVQLFIQRSFLGLEEAQNGITPETLDRDRWDWMQRYRVWEANRKVFLYPENWIETNLRDDKSSFFKELEGELLQKDINKDNVQDALKSYLYKVDEVANMEVIGLHIEMEIDENGNTTDISKKLHVFSRTRNTPFFFYYRYFDMREGNWYPWEKMQVDIPGYDVEDPVTHQISGNGCYLAPVVWNGRLLVFFPQFMKKTKAVEDGTIKTTKDSSGNIQVPVSKPSEYVEIKMAWSEYRNSKWTQKQLSKDASSKSGELNFSKYKIIPSVFPDAVYINVDQNLDNDPGFMDSFAFDGTQVSLLPAARNVLGPIPVFAIKSFHKDVSNAIPSLQFLQDKRVNDKLTFTDFLNSTSLNNLTNYPGKNFYHPYMKDLLGKINTGQLEQFFHYNIDNPKIVADKDDAFGGFDHDKNAGTPNSYHELKRPYSLYNWELFFHTPVMLAEALSKAQQFEAAMKWYHFVFNPMAKGADDKRFWMFHPFKEVDAEHILETIFNNLKPNTPNEAINEWRNNPFKPHLVARSRPVAYMKWVVMKYIDNLVAWGDYLFRQDTIESINQATQLYILAVHILGPRPQMIPKRGKLKPRTYNSLLGKWDAFSNAMVELELSAPFSNQTSLPFGSSNGIVGLPNIFGFASSLYFCIPNNPKLMGYWDTIADRLFKIRHCENIQGVFRKLPLFEPPIDPALLVKAAAQGLSIDSVLNDLNTPMPNYRFYYLLQKALELCGELRSLGGGLIAALEKKDNELLALLRAKHESTMNNLVMEIKKKQLEESNEALQGLLQNRKSPEHRMKYYLQLIGEDTGKVPQVDGDFTELPNAISTPKEESGARLNDFEKEDMDKGARVADRQEDIGRIESLASFFHMIPTIGAFVTPIGVGANFTLGGSNFGSATQGIARWMQTDTGKLSYESTNAGKKGGFLRSLQDRVMQANAAGFEIKQIDKQMLSQKIRISITNQEITNQQKQIDNANEIEEFLKNKYTNDDHYEWSKGHLKTLYHQVYKLAFELAKKAERTYCFERGLPTSNFIQSGYWDAGRDGLFSGEQLFVGLKQLEAAYQEQRGYDYEVTKHISLRQTNPYAILQLKETGKCEFVLPELLFDMDYPGHYKRRIKSVSISIPCIVGPYTGLNATIRLLENKFRNTAIAKNAGDYNEKTEDSDDRFQGFIIPINAIAASSGQSDSGMFELNFKDERYLPFEGAGVISKWRLELPTLRQFDYNTISDVIMHVRYTASEGGERLKKAASDNVLDFIKINEELGQQEGLFAIVDLKHDLPNDWHKAMQVKEDDTERTLLIQNLQDFLPYFAKIDKDGKPRDNQKMTATDVVLLTHSDLTASEVSILQQDNEIPFSDGPVLGSAKTFAIRDEEIKMGNWKLSIKNIDKIIDKAILLVRFIIR